MARSMAEVVCVCMLHAVSEQGSVNMNADSQASKTCAPISPTSIIAGEPRRRSAEQGTATPISQRHAVWSTDTCVKGRAAWHSVREDAECTEAIECMQGNKAQRFLHMHASSCLARTHTQARGQSQMHTRPAIEARCRA
jgi:hypothetical protein